MRKSDYDVLTALARGEAVGGSRLKGELLRELSQEHMLVATRHGSRMSYRANNPEELARRFRITVLSSDATADDFADPFASVSRSELVRNFGDSKLVSIRTCPGFPVNVYEPLNIELGPTGTASKICLEPLPGAFTFVADWQNFHIGNDVVVVGVENMENFRFVSRQRYLFENLGVPILFASRYPQSGDFVRWLMSIPNRYIHFGDFDLAGIHIYQSEFRKYLEPSRCEFFIPKNIEELIRNGSQDRYFNQIERFRDLCSDDPRLEYLIGLIHKYHRGYDQEGLILQGSL